jgi:hypothetical protein
LTFGRLIYAEFHSRGYTSRGLSAFAEEMTVLKTPKYSDGLIVQTSLVPDLLDLHPGNQLSCLWVVN